MTVTVDIAAAKSILPAPERTSSAVKKGVPAQNGGRFFAAICLASLIHIPKLEMLSCRYSNPERTLRKYEERLIFLCGKADSFAVAGDPIPD
jgi:hypothetical protein